MKDPAFLFYSKDWIEGTAEYMPEEKGVYIDLLCHQHQRGGIPSDPARLAKMVGLSNQVFNRIWKTISRHFIEDGERLVNPKLKQVSDQRAEKSKINTINGTFAGLLRLGNFDSKQYKYLKSQFNAHDFVDLPKERITERLTEWLNDCLKSIGNGTINSSSYSSFLKSVVEKFSLNLPEGFEELLLEWLKYKSEKGQSYKETGMKNLITGFIKDSNSDLSTAKKMLNYSMMSNYSGLFPPKETNGKSQTTSKRDEKIFTRLDT